MKTHLVLLATLFLSVVCAGATEPALVRLSSGQLSTSDGFHASISAGPQSYQTEPGGTPFRLLWFAVVVPRTVGKTDFATCQLMIQDRKGRTLISVPLYVSDDKAQHAERVQLQISEKSTEGSELRFLYTDDLGGAIVKEYILPLHDHLSAAR